MFKSFLTVVLTVTFFTAVSSPILATIVASPEDIRLRQEQRQKIEEENERLAAQKIKRAQERCSATAEQNKKILGRYQENYPKQVETYRKVIEQLVVVITRAKAQGKNTVELETVLATLNQKVALLDTQVRAAVTQITLAHDVACSDTPAESVTEMRKARELSKTAFASMQDIRSYYQKTVRPAMKKLAAEAKTTTEKAQ